MKRIIMFFGILLMGGCANLMTADFYSEEGYIPITAGINAVILNNINGNIRVNYTDSDKITVKLSKRSTYGKEEAEKVKIKNIETGKTINISVNEDRADGVSIDFDVFLPRNASIAEISAVNGNITIKEVNGERARVETVNGNIKAENITGKIAGISTVNGNIGLQNTKAAKAETVNGNIKLANGAQVNSMKTVNGKISNEDE